MTLPPCIEDCGLLTELGPPPDLIVNLPPPPVPSFLQNSADIITTNGTCDFCNWARGQDVPYTEVSRKIAIDETTYFITISSCIGIVILSILTIIIVFRCKEAKVKPVPDTFGKRITTGTVPSSVSDTTLYVNSSADSLMSANTQPKILWSGLETTETSPYVLQHQPVSREDPELLSHYEYIDYGSIGHTYAYPVEVVRIMNDNENRICADSLDASFENCGFVDSENHATSL